MAEGIFCAPQYSEAATWSQAGSQIGSQVGALPCRDGTAIIGLKITAGPESDASASRRAWPRGRARVNEIDSNQLSNRIQSLVDALRAGSDDDLSMSDVAAVTEVLITTMRRYFAAVDTKIYAEFRDLAEHISQTRTDIVRLQADKIKSEKIPKAGKELAAIVRSTEEATDTIMGAAEEIMGADTADAEAYQTLVNDACMRIFEACSFQDLTGQRITKVVKTFTYIEDRISTLLEAHGDLLPAAGDDEADETAPEGT